MTKILKIEGTDILIEVEGCGPHCPGFNGEYEECRLLGDRKMGYTDHQRPTPDWCPLPDKEEADPSCAVGVWGKSEKKD